MAAACKQSIIIPHILGSAVKDAAPPHLVHAHPVHLSCPQSKAHGSSTQPTCCTAALLSPVVKLIQRIQHPMHVIPHTLARALLPRSPRSTPQSRHHLHQQLLQLRWKRRSTGLLLLLRLLRQQLAHTPRG